MHKSLEGLVLRGLMRNFISSAKLLFTVVNCITTLPARSEQACVDGDPRCRQAIKEVIGDGRRPLEPQEIEAVRSRNPSYAPPRELNCQEKLSRASDLKRGIALLESHLYEPSEAFKECTILKDKPNQCGYELAVDSKLLEAKLHDLWNNCAAANCPCTAGAEAGVRSIVKKIKAAHPEWLQIETGDTWGTVVDGLSASDLDYWKEVSTAFAFNTYPQLIFSDWQTVRVNNPSNMSKTELSQILQKAVSDSRYFNVEPVNLVFYQSLACDPGMLAETGQRILGKDEQLKFFTRNEQPGPPLPGDLQNKIDPKVSSWSLGAACNLVDVTTDYSIELFDARALSFGPICYNGVQSLSSALKAVDATLRDGSSTQALLTKAEEYLDSPKNYYMKLKQRGLSLKCRFIRRDIPMSVNDVWKYELSEDKSQVRNASFGVDLFAPLHLSMGGAPSSMDYLMATGSKGGLFASGGPILGTISATANMFANASYSTGSTVTYALRSSSSIHLTAPKSEKLLSEFIRASNPTEPVCREGNDIYKYFPDNSAVHIRFEWDVSTNTAQHDRWGIANNSLGSGDEVVKGMAARIIKESNQHHQADESMVGVRIFEFWRWYNARRVYLLMEGEKHAADMLPKLLSGSQLMQSMRNKFCWSDDDCHDKYHYFCRREGKPAKTKDGKLLFIANEPPVCLPRRPEGGICQNSTEGGKLLQYPCTGGLICGRNKLMAEGLPSTSYGPGLKPDPLPLNRCFSPDGYYSKVFDRDSEFSYIQMHESLGGGGGYGGTGSYYEAAVPGFMERRSLALVNRSIPTEYKPSFYTRKWMGDFDARVKLKGYEVGWGDGAYKEINWVELGWDTDRICVRFDRSGWGSAQPWVCSDMINNRPKIVALLNKNYSSRLDRHDLCELIFFTRDARETKYQVTDCR